MDPTPYALDAPRRALRDALLAFRPADAAEDVHRDAILRLVETERDCFSRRLYMPGHITGSAFVACAATGRVLLHRHLRLGRWLQMGGHDDGEVDPAATALREAREESGLDDLVFLSPGILDLDVHAIPAARGEPPHLHHDVRYALLTAAPERARHDASESAELAWFAPEEAARLMGEPGAQRALDKMARLLAARAPGPPR